MEEEQKIQNYAVQEEYECMICFELAKLPHLTSCCKKLYCGQHQVGFKNKCPNCRNTPFSGQIDYLLQAIIIAERLKKFDGNEKLSCTYKCPFKGNYQQMAKHAKDAHQTTLTSAGLINIIQHQDKIEGQQFVEKYKQKPQPRYGVRKENSDEQRQEMINHVNNCNHEMCYRLWSGPWGIFIGGQMGSTHFDLTECDQGKILNQNIQWDYENPAY